MNETAHEPANGQSSQLTPYNLDVVLAYEDYTTGRDSMGALTRLAENTGLPRELAAEHAWEFQMLESPALRKIAARQAAEAEVIIIALHGSGRLPVHIMHWIELGIRLRTPFGGDLVALIYGVDEPTRNIPSVEAYLERCARRAGMTFFVQKTVELRESDNEPGIANPEDELTSKARAEMVGPTWPQLCRCQFGKTRHPLLRGAVGLFQAVFQGQREVRFCQIRESLLRLSAVINN